MSSLLPYNKADTEILTGAKSGLKRRNEKMGFALSKLADFARGRGRGFDTSDRTASPVAGLRRADSHPDAAPRPPLVVSRDISAQAEDYHQAGVHHGDAAPLQAPHMAQRDDTPLPMNGSGFSKAAASEAVEEAVPAEAAPDWLATSVFPRVPEPMPWDAIKQEMARIQTRPDASPPLSAVPAWASTIVPAPVHTEQRLEDLSVDDLARRLTAGLARRAAKRADADHSALAVSAQAASVVTRDHVASGESFMDRVIDRDKAADHALELAMASLRGLTKKVG
jgi:hypothetical protein